MVRVVRLIVTGTALAGSVQAAAYDAARCNETRQAIAKLQADLSRGPTAEDRTAYERALSVYRKVEPEFCGSGPVPSAGTASRPTTAAALQSALGALQALDGALSRDEGAARSLPGDAHTLLAAPPAPSGSVTGPMTIQRLPSPGQPNGTAASSPLPRLSQPTATVLQPDARQPDASVPAPAVAQPAVTARAPAMQALEQAAASPFPTDDQIALVCATAVNPSFCELARERSATRIPLTNAGSPSRTRYARATSTARCRTLTQRSPPRTRRDYRTPDRQSLSIRRRFPSTTAIRISPSAVRARRHRGRSPDATTWAAACP